MIITCNCGEKKFTLPDNSIPESGRMVQCGYCGLKWKQFPVKIVEKNEIISKPVTKQSITRPVRPKKPKSKKKTKKKTGPDLYSPEYLAKKHGIHLSKEKIQKKPSKIASVSFGFYNYLIVFSAFILLVFGILINTEDQIISRYPNFEIYFNYLFEAINNIIVIIQDFFYNLY
tara:strand:+ start:49 stop:567 length:519 start_codon:yes stop_codon:yes gene_type:complete